jgi:hypothetical protein
MMRVRKSPAYSAMDIHDLWVLAFKMRQEAMTELHEMRPRSTVQGTLSLLGMVLNELRLRGVQGRLELPNDAVKGEGQGKSSR